MSRFPRLARVAAVAALAASSLTLLASSPASAAVAPSGTLVATADGFTVTYAGDSTATQGIDVGIFPAGHTCAGTDTPPDSTYWATSLLINIPALVMPASPVTYTFGSTIAAMKPSPQSSTLAAGSYTVCLYSWVNNVRTALSNLDTTIIDPSTTTTTTTSTTVVEEPATPTFTG